MNEVILLGRLTADPIVRYTNEGTPVAQFSIAVDRQYSKDKQREADFFNCVVWRQAAEAIGNYVHKGHRILINGRLQNRSYEKNGEKRTVTEIIVNNFEFIEKAEKTEKTEKQSAFDSMADEIPF